MPRGRSKRNRGLNEKALTKGEARKLKALRTSIGDELGTEAFTKWYASQHRANGAKDGNVAAIEKALNPLVDKVRFPRGTAYTIRRGRGRFVVEPIELRK